MSAQHHPHPLPENYRQAAAAAKAWPFAEARKLSLRLKREQTQQSSALKRIVRFQTGYGPSGLPHIGTFGEVLRTSMVRNAFAVLEPDVESELVCFSDDMDGLRKIPETISNPESLRPHLGKPLSAVPDPFGCCSSYAQHNNKALEKFLDDFGFTYTFQSATEGYRSGKFDRGLQRMLECYQPVLALMQASLGEERKQSYSPFLPLCPESGVVLQVPVEEVDATKGTILYRHLDGSLRETSVFGGKCKLQWKPDWAMRWFVLDIDYEMYGKDLIPSAEMSQQILRLMSKNTPPAGFAYELFLDEKGEKISKSRGNGLTIEQWLTYASADSLAYYMYKKPKTAKRLFFDCIPRCLDEYLGDRRRFDKTSEAQEKVENPVFHIELLAPHPPRLQAIVAMRQTRIEGAHAFHQSCHDFALDAVVQVARFDRIAEAAPLVLQCLVLGKRVRDRRQKGKVGSQSFPQGMRGIAANARLFVRKLVQHFRQDDIFLPDAKAHQSFALVVERNPGKARRQRLLCKQRLHVFRKLIRLETTQGLKPRGVARQTRIVRARFPQRVVVQAVQLQREEKNRLLNVGQLLLQPLTKARDRPLAQILRMLQKGEDAQARDTLLQTLVLAHGTPQGYGRKGREPSFVRS